MTTATETNIRLTPAEAGLLLGLVRSATGMEGVPHSGLRDPDEIEEAGYELLLYARLTRELQHETLPTGQEVLKFLAECEREREEMLGDSCGDEHDGEFVLRDESGSVSVVPPFNTEVYVAVQCQRCRRFGGDVSAMDAGGWTCYGEDSEGACRKAKDLEAWDRRHEEH